MDEYHDHLVSSSFWVNRDAKEVSSWSSSEPVQPNMTLPNSHRLRGDGKINSPINMINQIVEYSATQDTSSFILGGESDDVTEKGLISGDAQLQKEDKNFNSFQTRIMNGSLGVGNMSLRYDTAFPLLGSLNLDYPKQLPVVGDLASLSFTEAGNVGPKYDCEQSEYHISFKDLQSQSSTSQLWPSPSYDGASSLSSAMGQDRTQGCGPQERNLDGDMDIMGKRYVNIDKILQPDQLSASATTKATSAAPIGSCSGAGKPRARARRGQATDPHSIAERLRREKITERMKNLQELVPNTNKIDKASMLDEIIEYVKFLQLQVKVLSMSRLGAAGAVIPLITDGQAEGSNSLSLSPSAGLGVNISPFPDQIAFEQEVVKLMESNVTMAMQYLQSKGLCLMPIALAAALSSGKASTPASEERKKFGVTNVLVHKNSSSSSCGLSSVESRCRMIQ